jgi:hypothetical protein
MPLQKEKYFLDNLSYPNAYNDIINSICNNPDASIAEIKNPLSHIRQENQVDHYINKKVFEFVGGGDGDLFAKLEKDVKDEMKKRGII